MKTTLVILAAGIGARYGAGVKQLAPVGPNGELIIDYSIHDAIAAGFNKIIFIIRKEIKADFQEVIGNRIEKICTPLGVEIKYAFQSLKDVPIPVPEGRVKPWGTGQAVLACKGLLKEPFAVINSDDYYGKDGFVKAAAFLKTGRYGLVGYVLKNTLSDNGGVTRGICTVKDGKLVGIDETRNIIKTANGAEANGRILPLDALVSMNFWCFPKHFIHVLETGFPKFLNNLPDPQKSEYLLPVIVDGLLKEDVEVEVLSTDADWFGITYQEDKASVIASFQALYAAGAYDRNDLYADIYRR